MKIFQIIGVCAWILTSVSSAVAGLDFDQEIIAIPDTHESKQYLWKAEKNPLGLQANIENISSSDAYTLVFNDRDNRNISSVDIFITDSKLDGFFYSKAVKKEDGSYVFHYPSPSSARMLVEIVGESTEGTFYLRRQLKGNGKKKTEDLAIRDDGYTVTLKQFPKKVYADHVVTFVFNISKDGRPVIDLDDGQGVSLRTAAWRKGGFLQSVGDFVPALPTGNGRGPEIAVSMVFRESGNHKVFVEFYHQGKPHHFATELRVLLESTHVGKDQPWGF